MNKRIESWMSTPTRFAKISLDARLARLLEQVERCSVRPGTDEVHDLRVSIRRFSQALRIFAAVLSAKPVKAMRKTMHPVMEAAGWVRDLDVGMERLLDEGLEENDVVLEEMRAERHRGELALRGRLLLLQSIEPERTWPAGLRIQTATPTKKDRALAWSASGNSGENALRILPRMAREFFVLGRVAVKPEAAPAQLHAFRLSAKRFRYTLELFEPMYGPMLAERLELVRKIQSVLGERQDCVVLDERLRQRTGAAGAGRHLLVKLNAEGRALEEKFRRYWRETFDAEGAEALWVRYLERRPVEPGVPRGAIRKSAAKRSTLPKRRE